MFARANVVRDRILLIRTREHAVTDKESAIYKHLRTCEHLAFIHNLFNLQDTLNNAKQQLGAKKGESKLLGVPWNKEKDKIQIRFPTFTAEPTKRGILAKIA